MDDRMRDQINDTALFLMDLQTQATLWMSDLNQTRREDGEILKQLLVEAGAWMEK